MTPKTEYVTLAVSDGSSMRAYVAHPEGTPRAALLVFQEAFGVNAHIRDVTQPICSRRGSPFDFSQAIRSHRAGLGGKATKISLKLCRIAGAN